MDKIFSNEFRCKLNFYLAIFLTLPIDSLSRLFVLLNELPAFIKFGAISRLSWVNEYHGWKSMTLKMNSQKWVKKVRIK